MPETILVVEDEPALQETLAYNLKKEGYTVKTAGDGRVALETARKIKPDLLVLDIMLPELDGFEVARIIRKEMTTPILMLTARDDEIDRVVFPCVNLWRASKRSCAVQGSCAKNSANPHHLQRMKPLLLETLSLI